ncbi:hypothetical protein BHE74_00020330 [Ensete ventricosum]|nr:hypothetical protein BHE74_00020330 [Ensete ventricosum]RZR89055.1 hypothetical protein BHM03_00016716 [Ensete ventricosum]
MAKRQLSSYRTRTSARRRQAPRVSAIKTGFLGSKDAKGEETGIRSWPSAGGAAADRRISIPSWATKKGRGERSEIKEKSLTATNDLLRTVTGNLSTSGLSIASLTVSLSCDWLLLVRFSE